MFEISWRQKKKKTPQHCCFLPNHFDSVTIRYCGGGSGWILSGGPRCSSGLVDFRSAMVEWLNVSYLMVDL